jgi:OPA family glycerol-3-phosphate transporter-like MFS transporter
VKLSRAQWRTLFVVWLTYGAFYLCRVNIGPARVEVERAFTIDPLEMGLVLGALKIGYAIGQLVNGQLAERFGPKRILLAGLFGSVTACCAFAAAGRLVNILPSLATPVNAIVHIVSPSAKLGPAAALLLLIWFANGLFQAGGWPPTVKIMANWYTPTQRGRMMGILGTSYQLGSALTIAASGALVALAGNDFRAAFLVPAVILAGVGVHARIRMRERPAAGEADDVATVSPGKAVDGPKMSIGETLLVTFTNPRIWVLALALFGLDIVRYGFLDWAPGHLKKLHGSGVLLAGLKVAVFPLAGGLGALASGWVTDRWFQSRRAPVIAITLGLVGVLTLVFDRVAVFGAGPTVACLAAIGFCLYGAQILLVGTAAQDFAKRGTTAAAAGFVDFMGYLGAFGGDVVTGWLLKNRDFHSAIMFWATAALVAAVLSATLWRARPPATAT